MILENFLELHIAARIAIAAIAFIAARWLVCWYFKINARLDETKRTNEMLREIRNIIINEQAETYTSYSEASQTCRECHRKLSDTAAFCERCGTRNSEGNVEKMGKTE